MRVPNYGFSSIRRWVKCVRIRGYSAPYFPSFGLNTEIYSVSLRIHPECGKIRTRITPIKDIFHAVRNSSSSNNSSIYILAELADVKVTVSSRSHNSLNMLQLPLQQKLSHRLYVQSLVDLYLPNEIAV